MPQSHAIISCARSWIGTRFHHQGRLKKTASHKGGVDCLGLLIGIANEMQIIGRNGLPLSLADETHYSHQPDNIRLRKCLAEVLSEVPKSCMAHGDVILLCIDNVPQHLAIVSDYPPLSSPPLAGGEEGGLGIIHAYAPAKAVVEHGLDDWWIERIETVFRV